MSFDAIKHSLARYIRLEIVVADRGWIVEKLAKEIAAAAANQQFETAITDQASGKADLTYFIPYSCQTPVAQGLVGAWFTHQEMVEPAKSNFVNRALEADFCLTPAKRYQRLLQEAGSQQYSHGQQVVTQSIVECLDEGVLCRFPRRDVMPVDASSVLPIEGQLTLD